MNASAFQATIYDKNGSLAVGKNVTFNINGVFYTKTTDSNGVASLGIALRPGNYTITTMYDALDVGNNVTVISTLVTKRFRYEIFRWQQFHCFNFRWSR